MRTHTQTAARSHPRQSRKAVSSSTVHTCSAHRRSTCLAAPMHISRSVSPSLYPITKLPSPAASSDALLTDSITPVGRGHSVWQGCSSGHSNNSPVGKMQVMLLLSNRHSTASHSGTDCVLLLPAAAPAAPSPSEAPGRVGCAAWRALLSALPAAAEGGCSAAAPLLLLPAACAGVLLVHQLGRWLGLKPAASGPPAAPAPVAAAAAPNRPWCSGVLDPAAVPCVPGSHVDRDTVRCWWCRSESAAACGVAPPPPLLPALRPACLVLVELLLDLLPKLAQHTCAGGVQTQVVVGVGRSSQSEHLQDCQKLQA